MQNKSNRNTPPATEINKCAPKLRFPSRNKNKTRTEKKMIIARQATSILWRDARCEAVKTQNDLVQERWLQFQRQDSSTCSSPPQLSLSTEMLATSINRHTHITYYSSIFS